MNLLRAFALFAILLGITSCSRSKSEPSALLDRAWAPYLESVSDAEISRKGPIRLRFVEAMVDSSDVGKEFQGDLSFEPAIPGTATWESSRDLVFKPHGELANSVTYLGRLSSKGLRSIPHLDDFVFKFRVVAQKYSLEWNGFTAQEGADTALFTLDGMLATTDFADSASLTRFLSVSQAGVELGVSWSPDPLGLVHVVRIRDVRREKKRSSLRVRIDPRAIGMEEGPNEHDLAVPAAGEFDLLFAKAVDGPGQSIQLQFTDPVSPQSDLASMVRIEGLSGLKFEHKGSRVEVFLPKVVAGSLRIDLDARLTSKRGVALGRNIRKDVEFKVQAPGVKFVGQGVILPESERLVVPIEATTLREITVEAFQVYASNMGQFLQVNDLEGDRESRRVGRFLWRKRVKLFDSGQAPRQWTRYGIDVTDLLKENRGGLFRIHLKIDRGQSAYPCDAAYDTTGTGQRDASLGNWDGDLEEPRWQGWGEEWDEEDEGEEEPSQAEACTDQFYQRTPQGQVRERNLLTSNLGLLAKAGMDGNWLIAATDLTTGQPLSGVDVVAHNYQGQPIGKVSTSGDGMARLKPEPGAVPFFLKATKGGDVGYLKVSSGSALPTSHFKVGGDRSESGPKGVFFGERGVWRPGDSLFLTLLVDNKDGLLPLGHPIRFELRDPSGKLLHKESRSLDPSGFQVFRLATHPESPTGNWTASAWVGDRQFTRRISVEAIKPNRLEVGLKWKSDTLRSPELSASLTGRWLQGASAAGLKAEVTAALSPVEFGFPKYPDHVFADPLRHFSSDHQEIWKGTLDANGKAAIETRLELANPPSSALQARFSSQITEPGGDVSRIGSTALWLPFDRSVGLLTPLLGGERNSLHMDSVNKVQVVVVDGSGKPVATPSLHATITKVDWNWWYESNASNQAQFQQAQARTPVADTTLSAPRGVAEWNIHFRNRTPGRYFLRVCDATGEEDQGHCAGKLMHVDWFDARNRPAQTQPDPLGASMLSVGTDKKSYLVGQTAILSIPSATKGRALVSLETGTKILKTFWTEAKPGGNRVEIPLDTGMAPGFYAHVTLIQPHEGRKNDLPLRLYGIVPLKVEDPSTRLLPEIVAPSEMAPRQDLKVRLREKQGRPMTYTLAVVDEGLLALTGFKTPDPLGEFRRTDALGVKTWDLFDHVVGAYGGQLDRILSIGGDGQGAVTDPGKPNRFPPIVRFVGPFHLDRNGEASHAIPIPEYVGKVRVMVVAGEAGKWGAAQTQVYVRKPLMILPTLPRVVRPGEEVVVGIDVFAMKDGMAPVQVGLEAKGWIALDGLQRTVNLPKSGESLVRMRLKVPDRQGAATLRFTARSGGETAEQTVELPIVPASQMQTESGKVVVEPGRSWITSLQAKGMDGTREGWLEVSSAPNLGIGSRVRELIGYPYGCLEQTTSAAFPQLLLDDAVQLSPLQRNDIQKNIRAAIARIHGNLRPGGILAYWPDGEEQPWASLWAGHFLLEARSRGYEIPGEMMPTWKAHQQALASRWWSPGDRSGTQEQAYRLYLLALAQSADLSAMNRLRTIADRLSSSSRWMLAMAYALSGQAQAAASLTQGPMRNLADYPEPGSTYGSRLRDQALATYALSRLGRKNEARQQALAIGDSLATLRWFSTQSMAWSLLALTSAFGNSPESWSLGMKLDGKSSSLQSQKPMTTFPLETLTNGGAVRLEVTNPTTSPLYLRWVTRGIPAVGLEKEESKGLEVSLEYSSLDGSPLDPAQLPQGKDFRLKTTITNKTDRYLSNLALRQLIPSGWELRSTRMDGLRNTPGLEYQDLRDDRALSFFHLDPKSSLVVPLVLHASFPGTFQLPSTVVESMYEGDLHARTRASTVVVKP